MKNGKGLAALAIRAEKRLITIALA